MQKPNRIRTQTRPKPDPNPTQTRPKPDPNPTQTWLKPDPNLTQNRLKNDLKNVILKDLVLNLSDQTEVIKTDLKRNNLYMISLKLQV